MAPSPVTPPAGYNLESQPDSAPASSANATAPASSANATAPASSALPPGYQIEGQGSADEESQLQPFDPNSHGKFTTQENYPNWAKNQPKAGPNSKPGEYEAWLSAHESGMDTLGHLGDAAVQTATGVSGASAAGGLVSLGELGLDVLPGGLQQAKTFILKKLAQETPQLFGHEAVKETMKRYAVTGLQSALKGVGWTLGAGATATVLHSVWEDLFGKKK